MQGLRVDEDVNAVVSGYLRDLAFAQSSPQKMFGYKRAAAAILSLDRPLTGLLGPDGALPRGGCDRMALTDADRDGRNLFAHWCREAGLALSIDAIGNMFARREGSDPSLPPAQRRPGCPSASSQKSSIARSGPTW